MSDHTHTRLETAEPNEEEREVIMYLAPNVEYRPTWTNSLQSTARPEDRPPLTRDRQMWSAEFTLQGAFISSDDLPVEHEQALLALDDEWTAPVSAVDQKNRLAEYLIQHGGPFYLHDGDDHYVATNPEELNIAEGIYPAVYPTEWRPPRDGGHSRIDYMVKFQLGAEN